MKDWISRLNLLKKKICSVLNPTNCSLLFYHRHVSIKSLTSIIQQYFKKYTIGAPVWIIYGIQITLYLENIRSEHQH